MQARRHIAFFLKAMEGGGAERVTATLAGAFAARGRRVDLVLAERRGPMLEQLSPAVRVVDLGAGLGIRSLAALARASAETRTLIPSVALRNRPRVLAALAPLERYLRRERPDALVSAMNWNNLVAIWARELAGVETRLLVCEHTTLSQLVRTTRKSHQRSLPRFVRAAYPRADVVAAVSRGAARDLAELAGLAPEGVETLYNPIDVERVAAQSREPVAEPWLAPGEPPLVLAVGRLKAEKDYPTLLRAFARVRAERPARLLVLGEGERRGALEAQVRELGLEAEVRMPGFAANPYAYMSRAAVFVLSSTWEGLPTVLPEALACGAPVVATDCRHGPRELLDEGRYGTLVPVGDPEGLARAIQRALEKEPDRAHLRRGAERFSVERCVSRYLELLDASP